MRCFIVPDGGSASTQNSYAQIIAIHAALLSNGKIVYFSGDQHDPGQFANSLFDHARLFDCSTFTVSTCTPASGISDLFCCGHAFLADGRLLIAGGTLRFDGFLGSKNGWIFDPASSSFQAVAQMNHGRWYPTLVTLGNGHVLALSGISDDANNPDQDRDMEVFDGNSWTVEGVLSYATDTLYPRVHLLPDGRVFFVTSMNGECMAWKSGMASPASVCASPFTGGFSDYTSALLPLLYEDSYAPRILVANLQQPQIIDLSVSSPAWSNTNARAVPASGLVEANPPRTNGTLTILPTGEVLSAGGEQSYGDESRPVLRLEIYRHDTNSWAVMPVSTTVNRAYHSVALLMPDGRVWFAGSNKRCDWSFHNSGDYSNGEPTDLQENKNGVPVDNRELRIEIFEPWYFGRTDRPTISITQSSVSLGRHISFTSPQASTISRVALLRAGSSTHAFNCDQRYIGIPFTVNGNNVTATVPNNENLVPPGSYMIFVLAQVVDPNTGAILDVPSVGHFIKVTNTKFLKELLKELKPELIEHLKVEIEIEPKLIAEVEDPFTNVGDPAEVLQRIAAAVDNLSRVVTGGRAFIRPEERPLLPVITPERLASVPIHPIDKDTLARQLKMEGMMDAASQHGMNQKPMDQKPMNQPMKEQMQKGKAQPKVQPKAQPKMNRGKS